MNNATVKTDTPECIYCGDEIPSRRAEILDNWKKPLTCVSCASNREKEGKAAQYQLAPEHDVLREDAPYFKVVLSPGKYYGYNHGNAARLGRQPVYHGGGNQ